MNSIVHLHQYKLVHGILIILFLLVSLQGSVLADTVEDNGRAVIDHLGRVVILPETIERPIALTANLMEALFVIGLPPVATVNNYRVREEANDLPKLGQQGNINIEAVYAVEPDLIIAHRRHQGQMISSLEEITTVFVIDTSQVGEVPLYDTVLFLGNLLGLSQKAQLFVESIESLATELATRIAEEKGYKTAMIIEDGDSIRAAQIGSGFGAILTGLRLKNIVPEDMPGSSQESFVPFDIETIIAADPDLILIRPAINDPEHNRQRLEMYKNNPTWAGLKAVQNNAIKMLPFKMHPGRATTEEMFRMAADTILSEQ